MSLAAWAGLCAGLPGAGDGSLAPDWTGFCTGAALGGDASFAPDWIGRSSGCPGDAPAFTAGAIGVGARAPCSASGRSGIAISVATPKPPAMATTLATRASRPGVEADVRSIRSLREGAVSPLSGQVRSGFMGVSGDPAGDVRHHTVETLMGV